MSALTVTLGADITALTRAMAGATELVSASARRMGKITGAGLAGLGKGGAATLSKGFDLAAIGLKAGIGAALAGGAAAVGVGVKAVNQAADFEQTKVAFTTLIGSAGKAEEVLGRLRKFADETPFEFPEIADAGRKLIAFGEDANTMPDTLRRIGDVSAGIQAPISEIAEIYGKARVQGRLFAEDVNQLTGRGIPIIGELAKQFHISESGVRKLVESGAVGFPQIEKAFADMTGQGGKFHGMMEAQSKTTKGLFSTLKDAVNGLFREFGKSLNDAIRPLVAQAIELVSQLTPMAVEAGMGEITWSNGTDGPTSTGTIFVVVENDVIRADEIEPTRASVGVPAMFRTAAEGSPISAPIVYAAVLSGITGPTPEFLAVNTSLVEWSPESWSGCRRFGSRAEFGDTTMPLVTLLDVNSNPELPRWRVALYSTEHPDGVMIAEADPTGPCDPWDATWMIFPGSVEGELAVAVAAGDGSGITTSVPAAFIGQPCYVGDAMPYTQFVCRGPALIDWVQVS